jgi:hypothetical protein
MELAVSMFADTVTYDDTAFPEAFSGKENLRKHLFKCADAFPTVFTFEVDDLVNGGDRMAVLWHVNNGGEQLPFTRGCSFYELDSKGRIQDGIDFVEPAPVKMGGPALFVQSRRPSWQRTSPLDPDCCLVAYICVVFISDGILPGVNALQLEQRTWGSSRSLSQFLLVSPCSVFHFSQSYIPCWRVFNTPFVGAMFAGFLATIEETTLLPTLPLWSARF